MPIQQRTTGTKILPTPVSWSSVNESWHQAWISRQLHTPNTVVLVSYKNLLFVDIVGRSQPLNLRRKFSQVAVHKSLVGKPQVGKEQLSLGKQDHREHITCQHITMVIWRNVAKASCSKLVAHAQHGHKGICEGSVSKLALPEKARQDKVTLLCRGLL